MLTINIPGRQTFHFEHLVLDFNGTIAVDGRIQDGVRERLQELQSDLNIYVLTADTNGSVEKECRGLPVSVHVIGKGDQAGEKKRFVEALGSGGIIAIGNGSNDEDMFRTADLAIAVLGTEGCALASMLAGDIVVTRIEDGLDLLLKPHRLQATLRK
ncbi:MAG: ATPase P [Bacillaceae bacterium]|nr:ATPase P [Bacillaceae bacterium]